MTSKGYDVKKIKWKYNFTMFSSAHRLNVKLFLCFHECWLNSGRGLEFCDYYQFIWLTIWVACYTDLLLPANCH